jgi:hypothetical protein
MRKNILKKSLAIVIISLITIVGIVPVVSSSSHNIEITKPSAGHWYWFDDEYPSLDGKLRIIGPITIMVDTFGDPDISYLKFYIDGNWKHDGQPGEWSWGPIGYGIFDPDLPWGTHVITVEAYDDGDNLLANASVEVIKVMDDWWNPDDGSCFLAGTNITMADNSDKKIEDIVVGDKVKSYDIATDGYTEGIVTKVYHHGSQDMGDHYLIINDNIRVTPNHLLYINGVLMLAGNAQIGDLLGGSDVAIYSIQQVFDQVPTYNFEVGSTTTGIETINMMYIAEELPAYPAKPGNIIKQVNELITQGEASTVQSVVNLLLSSTQYQQLQ